MQAAPIDALPLATGTSAATNPAARTQILHNLIVTNKAPLLDACYDAYPGLLVWDAESIMSTLTLSLARYGGPSEEGSFMRWATRFTVKETRRYEILAEILANHRRTISGAISANLWASSCDSAIEVQDLMNEVATLIFDRAHSLAQRGTAKLSTRLTALTKQHVRFHNTRCGRRHKATVRHLQSGGALGCEHLDEVELASMRSAEAPQYDCGYSQERILLN